MGRTHYIKRCYLVLKEKEGKDNKKGPFKNIVIC